MRQQMQIIKRLFGTRNQRLVRGYKKYVQKTNSLESEVEAFSDEQLRGKTTEFRRRYDEGETVLSLLPEAFAVVREAAKRTLQMRHFDVQLIGGMVLNDGKIAEMRTGEGKTLSSTLPVYLNALTGKGVHVVTVNDYLAERDANWMRPVHEMLGLTVGINLPSMDHEQKQVAYAADITYGTNNEFGFDYLRDNMVYRPEDRVQRPLHYAVIDEVDSILIDEARTPLIISGQAEESSELYQILDKMIPSLKYQEMKESEKEEDLAEERLGDYTKDEKNKQAFLTDRGHHKIEQLLNEKDILKEGDSLYDYKNITTMHYVNAALRAHVLYQRDVDYVVKDGEVWIVDEHTGRIMEGRRWSEGLHQAVEAKEGVKVQLENQTLASITFQNYFRLYEKLSGMTGTADTEAFELQKIYGLEVVVIPTNKPMIRDDRADKVFLDQQSKYQAILEDILECQKKQQPVLVGTASVESSELLSQFLKKSKVKHEVLNAKQHEREANIISDAGKPGAITIATNMAGRGTDIVLGGSLEAQLKELAEDATEQRETISTQWQDLHDQVIESGGLHVVGTERHESRRIDNQLRGRSGRQGDPGSSQFYLSTEDNLLRIFGGDRMSNLMKKLGVKSGDVIQHSMINRSIENAQRRVEGYNFDIRKNLLEYDDVANDQRKVIYQQRSDLLESDEITQTVNELRDEAIFDMVQRFMPLEAMEEQWDIPALEQQLQQDANLKLPIAKWLEEDGQLDSQAVVDKIAEIAKQMYTQKQADVPEDTMRELEQSVMLQIFDKHWKEHLAAMDFLRQGIHLRSYAQKNPAQEYKRESYAMFEKLLDNIKYDFVMTLLKLEINTEPEIVQPQGNVNLTYEHSGMDSMADESGEVATDQEQAPFRRDEPKIGRNDLCHCGSGKKFKHCHGKL
jgi:preprotein translocase subunit SecA